MGKISTFRHDVFVSFAHVDDQPDPGVDKGWVITLVETLKNRLAAKLGRPDSVDLWVDYRLTGADRITPAILEALSQSATLLLVMSPGYLASPWCQKEARTFLELVRQRTKEGYQIFVVERDKVDKSQLPLELQDRRGYRFWVEERLGKAARILGMPKPNPNDERYWDSIDDLAEDLAHEVARLKSYSPPHTPGAELPADGPFVFLAEATDDLDLQREDVKRYLKQAGLRILPSSWYPREPSAFQLAMDADLANSEVFIQLLSGVAGKKTADLPAGYAGLQLQRARAAGRRIIQWRSPELDLTEVADDDHRKLLESETVLAVPFEEFKAKAVDAAKRKPIVPGPPHPPSNMVFVNTEPADRSIAQSLINELERGGVGYILPLEQGKPAEIRRDLKTNLQLCDGLVIVYGNTTVTWVREQLWRCGEILRRRKRPVRALAIYDGPPEQKQALGFKVPNMKVINCRRSLDLAAIGSFLGQLGTDEPQ
jgi:hypothetical protein